MATYLRSVELWHQPLLALGEPARLEVKGELPATVEPPQQVSFGLVSQLPVDTRTALFNQLKMPFSCTFQLNNGAIDPSDHVQFVAYIDSSFGKFQTEEVPIADVLFNGELVKIFTTCNCFPSAKGQLVAGDMIDANTNIAFFAANGEDIPYSRPYAKIVR